MSPDTTFLNCACLVGHICGHGENGMPAYIYTYHKCRHMHARACTHTHTHTHTLAAHTRSTSPKALIIRGRGFQESCLGPNSLPSPNWEKMNVHQDYKGMFFTGLGFLQDSPFSCLTTLFPPLKHVPFKEASSSSTQRRIQSLKAGAQGYPTPHSRETSPLLHTER
jgi:hypothetical protein